MSSRTKRIVDGLGVLRAAMKTLPDDQHRIALLEVLAELEDNDCHKRRQFPKSRLHRVIGFEQAIYRADIDKKSGWRLHVQYEEGSIHLKDVLPGRLHDDVTRMVKAKKRRYS